MDTRLKIGVMGIERGVFILRASQFLKDEMVISAVCEINDATIEKQRKYFSEETVVYKDFDEFINSGLDGVVLCNYFHEHAKYAIKAMEAGVPVLSETTAAPSLGECIDLVEAYERTGTKYMLAANCPYFKPVHAMIENIEKEKYGKVLYAEAEYIHAAPKGTVRKEPDPNNLHWRNTLPSCYYNMHSLGPLMYITKSVPVKVTGKAVKYDIPGKLTNTPKTFSLTEMDSGAVFCTTGCVSTGITSKWFRVSCEYGTMETLRDDWKEEWLFEFDAADKFTKTWEGWVSSGCITEEEDKKYGSAIESVGHGGIDFILTLEFLKALRGEREIFFDVYRSAALSAAGILTWYSILDSSKEYIIPDFRDKEAREVFRGDYRVPFGKTLDDITLPYRLDD